MTYIPHDRADWLIPRPGLTNRKSLVGFDDDKPKPGITTCIYSYYNALYDPIAEIAEENWSRYCERNNIALRTYPGAYKNSKPGIVDGDRGKFDLYVDLRGLFEKLIYLDIDSLFLPSAGKYALFRDKRFLWTYDENGPNSSFLIARTDDLTEKHLRFAYERAAVENNVRHDKIEPGGISDQDSMRDLMCVPPFKETFANCFSAAELHLAYKEADIVPDTWVVTWAGLSFADKLTKMREYAHAKAH
jgi:hypothetical protein